MSARASCFARLCLWAFVALTLALCGCGRSSLLGDLPSDAGVDGRVDGAACGPATCRGCCDAHGVCQTAETTSACGALGIACHDCTAEGFEFCDPDAHTCGRNVAGCDAKTCSDGCCSGNTCLSGVDPVACGRFGATCASCAASGLTCDPATRTCATATACGPANCNGCCIGATCMPGLDSNACGERGEDCRNCAGQGLACEKATVGGACTAGDCNASNCPGCCSNGACFKGVDQDFCGVKGQQCTSCSALGEQCIAIGPPAGGVCSVAKCGPQNCKGCCQNDQCVVGTSRNSCGSAGAQCGTCPGGFVCPNGFCQPDTCGPSTCAGCCQGNTCVSGTSPGACGTGGIQCQACPAGATCEISGSGGGAVGGFCKGANVCGPGTCAGCCNKGVCFGGTDQTACGKGGFFCEDCKSNNEVCAGGACKIVACGPQNCLGCCTSSGACVVGTSDLQCGFGGAACSNCTPIDEVCLAQSCQPPPPPCTPATCPGCCDAQGLCEGGFLDTACGSAGASCADCKSKAATCATAAQPRVCSTAQATCPAPYATCPANVTEPILPVRHVCSANELQQARAACNQPDSAACQAYFAFEQQTNAACATCLAPFDVSFNDATGILLCIAPFVDPSCDHAIGCFSDCQTKSCAGCTDASSRAQCENDVQGGQCSSFAGALDCVTQPLFGGAATFCDPQNYPTFGGWLQGVGGHFCGP